MGNQTTSGIVEEERTKNAAREKSQEVCSPDELKEENQTQIQENGAKDLQEKADEDENEEHNGSVIEERDGKINELNEGRSNLSNAEQDKLCTIDEGMQNQNPNMNCTPQEAGGTTSDLQEDENMLVVKEFDDHVMEKEEEVLVVAAHTGSVKGPLLEHNDSTPQEAAGTTATPDLQEDHNMLVKDIDDCHVMEREDEDFLVADTPSVDGPLLETREDVDEVGKHDDHPQEDQCVDQTEPSDQEMIKKEYAVEIDCLEKVDVLGEVKGEVGKHDEHPQEEQCNSINAFNDQKARFVDQTEHSDQEMIKCDFKEYAVEIDCLEKVDVLDKVKGEVGKHDDHPQEEQCNSINALNDQKARFVDQTEHSDQEMIKCDFKEYAVEIDYLEKVDVLGEIKDPNEVNEHVPIQMEDAIVVKEIKEQKESTDEMILEEKESKADESSGASAKNIGVGAELRKCPSFDFGLSFRSEESDKTPLLYTERTPMRSLSSCANPRFQNRSVQSEYLGKAIAVDVEEKTIRMERSDSEELLKKGGDVITRSKQEDSTSGKKQENGLMASPSGGNADTISPKRRAKSSLFTTCICCTAAIS